MDTSGINIEPIGFNDRILQQNNIIAEINNTVNRENLNDRRDLENTRNSLEDIRDRVNIQRQLQDISDMLSTNTSTRNIIKVNKVFVITGIFSCVISNAFAILNSYISSRFYYAKNQYNWFIPYFIYSMCYNLYNLYNNIEYGKIAYYVKKNNLTIGDDCKINKNDIPWSKNKKYKMFKIICYFATFVSFLLSLYLIDRSFYIEPCLETEYDLCNIIKFIGYYTLSVLIIIFIFAITHVIRNDCCKNQNIVPEPVDDTLQLRLNALDMLHHNVSLAIENINQKISKTDNLEEKINHLEIYIPRDENEKPICSICTFHESNENGELRIVCVNKHFFHEKCFIRYLKHPNTARNCPYGRCKLII